MRLSADIPVAASGATTYETVLLMARTAEHGSSQRSCSMWPETDQSIK